MKHYSYFRYRGKVGIVGSRAGNSEIATIYGNLLSSLIFIIFITKIMEFLTDKIVFIVQATGSGSLNNVHSGPAQPWLSFPSLLFGLYMLLTEVQLSLFLVVMAELIIDMTCVHDSDVEASPLKKKQKVYKQKYSKSWEKDPKLGPIKSDPYKAFCKLSQKELVAGLSELRKHNDSKKHQKKK